MFKNHPEKEKIKFVVLPMAREILHTVCDVAMDPEELMKKFAHGQPICHGINFDFSRMYLYGIPDLWQVYTLSHVGKQKEIISQLRKTGGETLQKTNVMEVMKATLPKYEPFEDSESLWRRAGILREFMKENLRSNPLEGQQKYAIVCHSMIIACLTADGIDESDKTGFKGYTWCENCQNIPFNKY
jgi:hypothetical protein